MSDPKVFSVAVVLYPNNALLDFQGPMELLETASLNSASGAFFEALPGFPKPNVKFEPEYVAETREPIRGVSGPPIIATKTINEVRSKQFDILLIPGGIVKAEDIPSSVAEFVRAQVPGAQYVLTGTTSSTVEWVAKARWVTDGKIWTSAGVTAAQDMAYDFLTTVAGSEFATAVKGVVGFRATRADDDELADVFKLA
ncbi:hypothetical protein OPQ81_000503 [Rhizoctonia solani]|nr:hypothetical protein OPQ81_000503 [Rhizoctonia solani]